MTVLAAGPDAFGCPQSVSFDSSVTCARIPGYQNLIDFPNGPEGLLFRKLNSIDEGVATGGILLYQKNDSSKWIFYVGNTLRKVLGSGLFGWFATLRTKNLGTNSFCMTSEFYPSWTGYTAPADQMLLGGDLYIRIVDDNAFFNDEVVAIGIVTGANDGHGISRAVGDYPASNCNGLMPNWTVNRPMSYVATHVKMSTPFSKFIDDNFAAFCGDMPEEIKAHYIATKPALYAEKGHLTPTIAISTFWNGTQEGPGEMTITNREGTVFQNPWSYGLGSAGMETAVVSHASGGQNIPVINRMVAQAGTRGNGGGSILPFMMHFGPGATTSVPRSNGKIGHIDMGILRDGQLLRRSLVSHARFAEDAPTEVSLVTHIQSHTYPALTVTGGAPAANMTVAGANAQLVEAVQNGRYRDSIFDTGTLLGELSSTVARWDEMVKARLQ